MTNALTKYQQYTPEDIAGVDADVASNSGSVFLDVREGDNVVRILPPPVGRWPLFRTSARHYIEVPGLEHKVSFDCPAFEYARLNRQVKEGALPASVLEGLDASCPACAEALRLASSRNPLDKKRARDIGAGTRVLCNVLSRDNPGMGPRVLAMGPMIWKKVSALSQDKRKGGNVADPTAGGFDLIITKTVGGGGQRTKYETTPDRQNSPLADTSEEVEEILGAQHDLDAVVDATIPEELLEALGSVARAGRSGRNSTGRSGSTAADDARGRLQSGSNKAVVDAKGEEVDTKPAYDDDDPSTWE